MGEQRRVYMHGNSWVIPVTRRVRAHLRVLEGGDLFWHLGPKGEAIVTRGTHRIGGKPPGARLEKDLEQAHRTIERLRRQVAARPDAVYNEGVNEGRTRHMGELVKLGQQLDALQADVRELAARVPYRRHPVRGAASSRSAPKEQPSPSAPSSSSEIDGGADTSGAAPPGVPA